MTSTAADWAAEGAKALSSQRQAAARQAEDQQVDETTRRRELESISDALIEDMSRELAAVPDQWNAAGGTPSLRFASDGVTFAIRASDGIGSSFAVSWDVEHAGLRQWALTPRGREQSHVDVVIEAGVGRLRRGWETLSTADWIEHELRNWLRAVVGS